MVSARPSIDSTLNCRWCSALSRGDPRLDHFFENADLKVFSETFLSNRSLMGGCK